MTEDMATGFPVPSKMAVVTASEILEPEPPPGSREGKTPN